MELRQAALKVARLEPGQRAWMARQQRAWRRGGLLHEQVLLLALSGCDLELYDAAEWRQTAHDVAAYLMGSQIHPVSPSSPLAGPQNSNAGCFLSPACKAAQGSLCHVLLHQGPVDGSKLCQVQHESICGESHLHGPA